MAEENQIQGIGEIVIFNTEDGEVRVQVDTVNETIWLNQKGIAELFGVTVPNISYHLKNIFEEKELNAASVIKEILITAQSGARGLSKDKVRFYNLDAIIAVGYRVNSKRATAFRIWATGILKEYMTKGFALDDERFKRGHSLSHFKELLERIREIRISERVFYQQIKDIYKLSEDYDASDEMTIAFFKKVQNKLLWAVSGKTAAELVYYRANAELPMMGLTSTEVSGLVKATDVGIGKNYLSQEELSALKLIVEQYLSFAEAQAQAHRPMYMKDWKKEVDTVLSIRHYDILEGKGKISKKEADEKAEKEYETLRERLASFLNEYSYEVSNNISIQLSDIQDCVVNYENSIKALKDVEEELEQFEIANTISALNEIKIDESLPTLENLNQIIQQLTDEREKVHNNIGNYNKTLENLQEEYDEWEENCAKLKELKSLQSTEKKKYEYVSIAKKKLELAKEVMTAKYADPIFQGFRQYYEMLSGDEAVHFHIDANTTVTVDELGKQRDTDTLSSGYRDLIGICLRIALVDAMYQEEEPPLIMDDPFTNLDDKKVNAGMDFVGKLAEKYQIIYFTCSASRG